MKNGWVSSRANSIALFVAAVAWAALFSAMAEAGELKLKVMTFNLKYASDKPPNAWPDRRPVVRSAIVMHDADIVGTQEGLYEQLKDMDEDLEAYDWIGQGRRGGSAGEFMAVFYKRDRLQPVAYGHHWLSDTPHVVGSTSWGNGLPRMVTWVRFRETETGVEFYAWNTHFDHRSQEAREKSAEFIVKAIAEQQPRLPVVVTGDFNQSQTNVVHQTLVPKSGDGGFQLRDAWEVSKRIVGKQISTIHGWRGANDGDRRIDWVLISPEFECDAAQVVTHEENGQLPSDHFPVLGELTLKF